jgi:hypothetical protein
MIRHGDVMDMVVHQTVGPDQDLLGGAVFDKQFEINTTVSIVEKNRRLSIAALCQVIGIARDEISKSSGHEPSFNPEIPDHQRAPGF